MKSIINQTPDPVRFNDDFHGIKDWRVGQEAQRVARLNRNPMDVLDRAPDINEGGGTDWAMTETTGIMVLKQSYIDACRQKRDDAAIAKMFGDAE